jgi:hypothetical protein
MDEWIQERETKHTHKGKQGCLAQLSGLLFFTFALQYSQLSGLTLFAFTLSQLLRFSFKSLLKCRFPFELLSFLL